MQIISATLSYLIEENFNIPFQIEAEEIARYLGQFIGYECSSQEITEYRRAIKLINSCLANSLLMCCEQFQKHLMIKPKLGWKDLTMVIESIVENELQNIIKDERFTGIKLYLPPQITNGTQFVSKVMEYVSTTLKAFKQCLESLIITLSTNLLESHMFNAYLGNLIENELAKISQYFSQFTNSSADFIILYEKIKETVHLIVLDLQMFLYKMSQFSIMQMHMIDRLFKENSALLNVRTYQTIQVEVATYIYDQIDKYFLNEFSFFWREEFNHLKDAFIKSCLVNFYGYSQEKFRKIQEPKITSDFISSLQRYGIEEKAQLRWIQVIFKQDDVRVQNVWNDEKIIESSNGSLLLNNMEGLIIKTNNYMFFTTKMEEKQIICVVTEEEVKRTTVNNVLDSNSLKELIIQQVNKNEGQIDERKSIRFLRSNYNIQVSVPAGEIEAELSFPFQNFLKEKKYEEAPTGQGGDMTSTAVLAGGVLGAGFGMLIVDSLDRKMPWGIKLQRAGINTLESSAYGVIALQMPVIGMLIAQTYLFLNIHQLVTNDVLTAKNKIKKIGHFSVQASLGIGSAIAGQILIPIPFLGAFIGGTIGGFTAGLYAKFVVPATRSSIMRMLHRMINIQAETGELIFTDDVIDDLRINKNHFHENRPSSLSLNNWLTLAIVNLVNEVHYLFTLKTEEEIDDILKKLEKSKSQKSHDKYRKELIVKETEQEEVESISVKFEISRIYLEDQKISVFKHATDVNKFVLGMIQNFKIQ